MNLKKTTMLAILLAAVLPGWGADAPEADSLRGEPVGWARLKTPSLYWMRHATGDPVLMHFLRDNTSLNIAPTWYVADIENLQQMCAYPLLFSQGVHMVTSAHGRGNMAEYLRRGGFLLIDSCINAAITPDPDVFLAQQSRWLKEVVPESQIVPLPTGHPIYTCYFHIPDGRPPHTYSNNVYDPEWAKHGLYAIRIGPRMAGIISLSGLQCGWDRMIAPPGHDLACMRMLVNIYVYAMLQGG